MRIVIALGGNALLRGNELPEESTQVRRVRSIAPLIARLAAEHELVIVHGNGPQVGVLARENAEDRQVDVPYPLGDMVAESQGLIGLWIQQALANAGLHERVVTVVTQTVVSPNDPAWEKPSKFVGGRLRKTDAASLTQRFGWTFADEGDGKRRVVASPEPLAFPEEELIDKMLSGGSVVIAAGGGGVPVVIEAGALRSVEAVVDKDRAASLLAIQLEADLFVILTDIANVQRGWGTESASAIHEIEVTELEGESFATGSMQPKVDAVVRFSMSTGRRSAIGALDEAAAVITGTSGTQVHPASTNAARRASNLE